MPPADNAATAATHGGWPQWNESLEMALRGDLAALGSLPEHEARSRLALLEQKHRTRRSLVRAEIGEAPLAHAMEHLAVLADITKVGLAAGDLGDVADAYCTSRWRADSAVLGSLACVDEPGDVAAVTAAIRALYLPWAQDSATHLQQILSKAPYSGGTPAGSRSLPYIDGECILFVDGLRFDIGMRLEDMLRQKVRKDLVRVFSRQFPVPTYVVEFLLGRYCAGTKQDEIDEGLQVVKRQLEDRAVRAGDFWGPLL